MPTADSVEQADIELGQTIASQKEHPTVRALVKVGALGDQGPLYASAALVTLLALLTWNPRRARLGVSIFAAVATADLAKRATKGLVRRTRPWVTMEQREYVAAEGGSPDKREQSFPSGHIACTLAAARASARYSPGTGPFGGAFTTIIGLARMAKGDHWPLDVAAGLLVGWLAETISSCVLSGLGVPSPPARKPVRRGG